MDIEKFKSEFALTAYLQQYRDKGISFELLKETHTYPSKEEVKAGFKKGMAKVTREVIQGVEPGLIESFFKQHWEQEAQNHKGFIQRDFIDNQIEFFTGLHDDVKKEYQFIVKPMLAYLNSEKRLPINNIEIEKKETPHKKERSRFICAGIMHYNGVLVNASNSSHRASEAGFHAATSGSQFLREYKKFETTQSLQAVVNASANKTRKRMEDLGIIAKSLTGESKKRCLSDIEII